MYIHSERADLNGTKLCKSVVTEKDARLMKA